MGYIRLLPENLNNMENSLQKEYNDFMEWFKITHQNLFEKYARNISIPMKLGGE